MTIHKVSAQAIGHAVKLLKSGEVVAFPTETVYGLGAVALWDHPVTKIYALKSRPPENPLIVHVTNLEMAKSLAVLDDRAQSLIEAFWPGPLTIVVELREDASVSKWVTSGLPTVAIRSPSHDVARKLMLELDLPLAAPSANRSGRVSATSAAHVVDEFDDALSFVLDGGSCPIGLESTIVDLSTLGSASLLRPGGLARKLVEDVIGPMDDGLDEKGVIKSPGRLKHHYAPTLPLRLEARLPLANEAFLAFGPTDRTNAIATLNLSEAADLEEAAANLFSMLRALDHSDAECIAVGPVPDRGLGEAINDRLRRAATPKQ
ncbi:MAG: L-threonylcarbamoyladenylate synthase [Pseudomonadota bacterium]